MEQRLYQIQGIEQTIELASIKRKIIRQLPTGGGKTVEFAYIAQRYFRTTGKSVLILVHRQELMYQAKRTIKEICGFEACLITSETRQYQRSQVFIGMVESLVSRLNLFDNVGLVIVDECHIANFNKIHSIFLYEVIIGYSATPVSANKKMPLNRFYSDIVCGPQIKELIDMGYLAQNITRCPQDVVDATKFEIDKLKGDYNERQMATEFKLPRFVTNVVRNMRLYCKRQKTIVFNVTIDHSNLVNECLQECGYNSRHLGSDNEHEREEIIKWFHDTPDAILCNVGMTTVGFDEPTVRNIIINFATLSITKFIQCCGRGSRSIDDAWIEKHQKDYPYKVEKKDGFNIIDMGANFVRFGDWSDERDWDYIFRYTRIPGNGVAPVKTCPDCNGLVHAAVKICPLINEKGEQCMHEFESNRPLEQNTVQKMIIVSSGGAELDKMIEKHKNKYKYYTFDELGRETVRQMYKTYRNPSDEIKMRYFKTYFKLCCAWYDKTLAGKDGNLDSIAESGFHKNRALNNFNNFIKMFGGVPMGKPEVRYELPVPVDAPLLTSRRYVSTEDDNLFEW